MSTRHFLTLLDFSKEELMQVIKRGSELRLMQHEGVIYQPFVGRTLGMIFEKSSTRTRICLLYTSPSPRDLSTSRMPSSA